VQIERVRLPCKEVPHPLYLSPSQLFGFSYYDEIVGICPAPIGHATVAGRHDEFSASGLIGDVPPVT